MARVTITIDDETLEAVKAAMPHGPKRSLSAWIVDAIQRKLLARAELLADLKRMEAEDPYTWDTVEWLAAVMDQSVEWAADALGVDLDQRQAG